MKDQYCVLKIKHFDGITRTYTLLPGETVTTSYRNVISVDGIQDTLEFTRETVIEFERFVEI